MSDVKVYIREENMDKWRAIANKSRWVNTILANSDDTSEYGSIKQTPVGPATTVLSEILPGVEPGPVDKLNKALAALDAEIPEEAFGEFKHEIRGNEIWLTQIGGPDKKRGFLNPKTNEFVRYN
jgi:hypothetical protein